MDQAADKNRIDKLIAFFKTFKKNKPKPDETDYSSWNQTEAQYQKEQAAWLKQVKSKKHKKTDKEQ
jgi:hypothetical protein